MTHKRHKPGNVSAQNDPDHDDSKQGPKRASADHDDDGADHDEEEDESADSSKIDQDAGAESDSESDDSSEPESERETGMSPNPIAMVTDHLRDNFVYYAVGIGALIGFAILLGAKKPTLARRKTSSRGRASKKQ